MKMQSAIRLGVVSSIAATAVIALFAFRILHDETAEVRRSQTLSEIADKFHAVHILTASVKDGPDKSDTRQVKDLLLSLDGLLKGLSARAPREEVLMRQLRTSYRELGPLIDLWFASGQTQHGLMKERQDMLASQIWMKAQNISDDTRRLQDISQSRILAARQKTVAVIIVLIIVLAATNGVIYMLSVRSIVRAQRALLENRQDLNRAQAVAHVGSWRLDVHRNELTWSDESYRIAGIPIGTPLTYESFLAIVHPDDRQFVDRKWQAALQGEPYDIEHRFVVNGEVRWAREQAQLEFDRRGRFLVGYGAFHDITERKRMDEERVQLLESERAARAEAELAGRVKDEFLATLSHELRNPLSAILGWVRLMEGNAADAKIVRDGIKVISRNAKLQANLIADLLDMSRIVSGKIRLKFEAVKLADVVTAAVESIRHGAEAKEVRIQLLVREVSDIVQGDPARLQQVVWNLLFNAIKFTPRGGRVQVGLATKGSSVEMLVSDTGVGIKPEFLPHVFERFRQADGSITRQYGGLGLGLSIVKNLVELHGGTVAAASAGEGCGTTFTVRLPRTSKQAPTAAEPPNEQRIPLTSNVCNTVDLSGVTALAIDDQEDARDLLRRILEECHAQVITAASADEALQAIGVHRPHIVLCDISMPGKDGYQFIKELRDRGDDTPALAVTAFARPEDRLRAFRAGYQAHVSKPIEPAELVATVRTFIKIPAGAAYELKKASQ